MKVVNHQPSVVAQDPIGFPSDLEQVLGIAEIKAKPKNYDVELAVTERKRISGPALHREPTFLCRCDRLL